VNFEALLLFGSGLNHLSILSGNHVSCGDLHLVDHYSWIRIVIASISVYFHPFSLFFYPITKISSSFGIQSKVSFGPIVSFNFKIMFIFIVTIAIFLF
jgi:hypothetical protein